MAYSLDGKNQLVKCRFCGEMYSPTYKQCPFCNGDGTGRWDDLERAVQKASEFEVMGEYIGDYIDKEYGNIDVDVEYTGENTHDDEESGAGEAATPFSISSSSSSSKKGGKRLLNNVSPSNSNAGEENENAYESSGRRKNGFSIGRILGVFLAVGLMVAAVCLVVSIVKPLLSGKNPDTAESQPPAESEYIDPLESTGLAEGELSTENGIPGGEASVDVTADPASSETPGQSVGTPTSFWLSKEDFTFNAAGQRYHVGVTFEPVGTSAEVTWTSSDPTVASVSSDGWVTAVGRGTVNVTAVVEGVGQRSCIVRCAISVESSSGQPGGNSQGDQQWNQGAGTDVSSTPRLNRDDFTMGYKGEIFRMQVTGTVSPAFWSSSNPQVATIASDGTVTAVGRGKCTITATVDGKTLTCIVRCSF